MQKHNLKIAQWYISHTCNLSCKNCLSYNNFNISGHERWSDNAEFVERWGGLVSVDDFSIIGGEPLGNPDLDLWVKGTHKHFNTKDFKICTNGTQLERWRKNIPEWTELGVVLEIHTHDKSQVGEMWSNLRKSFGDKIKYVKGVDYTSNTYYDRYDWVGLVDDRVAVLQLNDMNFFPWGVKGKNENGEYEMYETRPKITHTLCQWNNCHYFYQGNLYKCGTLVGAQKFVTKYPTKSEHKELILDYKPVTLGSNNLQEDLNNLRNFLPQCGLCNNVIKHRQRLDATNKKEK
jgi:organic radical activating enzyme